MRSDLVVVIVEGGSFLGIDVNLRINWLSLVSLDDWVHGLLSGMDCHTGSTLVGLDLYWAQGHILVPTEI